MTPLCATIVGVVLQLIGASCLLFLSFRTGKSLGKFRGPVGIDDFTPAIEAVVKEIADQFKQQCIGFLFVLGGSLFQIFAATSAT